MKKKICILLCSLTLALSGCCHGETVIDKNGIEHPKMGKFISLSEEKYRDCYGYCHLQMIVYDKDTKIMYVIESLGDGFGISPYYVMNSNNEPIIGVYNDDLEDIE